MGPASRSALLRSRETDFRTLATVRSGTLQTGPPRVAPKTLEAFERLSDSKSSRTHPVACVTVRQLRDSSECLTTLP